jgi:hypothetical protein
LAASLIHGSSFETDANLGDAHTAADIYKIQWAPDTSISPGAVYMEEDYTATDIEYKATVHACVGLCHDFHSPGFVNPHVNKLIKGGVAQEQILVPLTAIKAYKDGDGIDVVVDKSQLEGKLAWAGAAPTVLNFTGSASHPNTGDQNGWRDQVVKSAAALPAVFNIDFLQNAYTKVDQKVNHNVSLDALNAAGACNTTDSFETEAEKQTERAVRETVAAIPGTPDILKFSFTHPQAHIKVDTGQQAESVLRSQSGQADYTLHGDPHTDMTICAGDKLPTSQ